MTFAVDSDSKCPDCQLKYRVKLCPYYKVRCSKYDEKDSRDSPKDQREDKTALEKPAETDKDLE